MIISVEAFYNVAAALHIAMLVLVVVFIVSTIVLFFAKLRIIREVNGLKAGLKKAIADAERVEDPHTHMETHAHEAGEALAKGDLVIARDGLLFKANRDNFIAPEGMKVEQVDLSKAPAEVQKMAAEMREQGHKGKIVAIRVAGFAQPKKPVAKKRAVAKKVAKKVIKKNK